MGVGANVLGYGDSDIDTAVLRAIAKGVSSTLNCAEEVELAKLLVTLHPWAAMARFARSGAEAINVAIRIARTYTKRDRILVCGYHGWSDTYLAGGGHLKGLTLAGVPKVLYLYGTTIPFRYNCPLSEFETLLQYKMPAAVVMEVVRDTPPDPDWLESIRHLCTKVGTVLIFDEITSGFRINCGGVHLTYGVDPDIAVFGKAIGNGYAISAILGTRPVMEAAQNTFISSTNWTERVGFTAAIATIQKFWASNVDEHLVMIGNRIKSGVPIPSKGLPPLLHFDFSSLEKQTLFTQLMLERGYLAGKQFYASYAHTHQAVTQYLNTVSEVVPLLATEKLRGPVASDSFQRLT